MNRFNGNYIDLDARVRIEITRVTGNQCCFNGCSKNVDYFVPTSLHCTNASEFNCGVLLIMQNVLYFQPISSLVCYV